MIISLEVKSIRRIILDKRKGTENMKERIESLLVLWNINEEISQIYDSTWAVGNDYVIKITDSFGSLKRNITIMNALDECGIPVAHAIPTVDGQDYIEYDGKYYLMMNKLSGTHIQDIYQTDYLNIAFNTGKILANLHSAFIVCEQKITFWNNSLLEEMTGWIYDTKKQTNIHILQNWSLKQL